MLGNSGNGGLCFFYFLFFFKFGFLVLVGFWWVMGSRVVEGMVMV